MMNSNIQEYIDFVRSSNAVVCEEQLLLCDYVEKVFSVEKLFVNEQQLEKYLSYQKYFPFQLLPWERFCFALHNCVYREDGQLRFPVLFILVGRGAGKNGYLAFEDFCLLTPTNGVKYYFIDIFAMSEDQAKTTFEDVYNILEDNKLKLKNYFYWNKEVIINLKTKSRLKFRTSGIKTKDGGRPGKVDFDEYHAYENMKIVDVATTGLGKKAHPRRTIITTQGDVRDGPLDTQIEKAQGILRGDIPDNGMLPFICKLDDKSEITDKTKWPKANPTLNYAGKMEYADTLMHELEIEFGDYLLDPVGNASFATKRMNSPQGDKENEVTSWDNIFATKKAVPDLTGQPCVWGLDYAMLNDFVAAVLLFKKEGIYYVITHSWVCKQSRDLHRVKYPLEKAEAEDLLTFVDDVEISPELPTMWLYEQSKLYNLVYGAMDHFRYSAVSKALTAAGFNPEKKAGGKIEGNVKLIRPSDIMQIAPEFTMDFAKHNIAWGDNSLMRWYTNNAKRMIDNKGNITFGKIEPKSRKTDGFMALTAARTVSDKLDAIAKMNSVKLGVWRY